MSEPYDTEQLVQEIEKGTVRVPDDVRQLVLHWLLTVCVYVDGKWVSGKVFEDFHTLEAVMKDGMIHARDFLDEPERSEQMAVNFRLYCVFSKIRRDLLKRFREDGRE